MGYKRLFVWVEGPDDERFFAKTIKPELEKKYDLVGITPYSTLKKDKVDNFLKSIKAMKDSYIFTADFNNSPCITGKKQELQNKFKNINEDKIVVVKKEIEGWYLAGLDNSGCKKCGIANFNNTDNVTKEEFNNSIPDKYGSRIHFMIEILKFFSIGTAKRKNNSFKWFIEKHDC